MKRFTLGLLLGLIATAMASVGTGGLIKANLINAILNIKIPYEETVYSATIFSDGSVAGENVDWINGSCAGSSTSNMTITCTLTNATLSPMNCAISMYTSTYNGNVVGVITSNTDFKYTGWDAAVSDPKDIGIVCQLTGQDYLNTKKTIKEIILGDPSNAGEDFGFIP